MHHNYKRDSCFIISPIGDLTNPQDEVHLHVESVRIKLIDRALAIVNREDGLKLKASRADMNLDVGDIWRNVLKCVLSDQLLFVIIAFDKPNVFYELGLAHAAARTVILLRDENSSKRRREFDISQHRHIDYRFGADGELVNSETVVRHLADTVKHALRKGEDRIAFGDPLIDPLNKQNSRFIVYDRFMDVSYPDWSRILRDAKREIILAGTTLLDLSKIDNDKFYLRDDDPASARSLIDFIATRILFSGINVTIVIMHEDNPSLEAMLKGTSAGVDRRFTEQVKQEIEWSTRRWVGVAEAIDRLDEATLKTFDFGSMAQQQDGPLPPEQRGTFRFLKLRRGQVKFRLTLTDQEVLATPILYLHGRNSSGPAFWALAGTAFYKSVRGELMHLLEVNEELIAAEVGPGVRFAP